MLKLYQQLTKPQEAQLMLNLDDWIEFFRWIFGIESEEPKRLYIPVEEERRRDRQPRGHLCSVEVIANNLPNNAANSIAQPLPAGQNLSEPKDTFVQNSTIKPVDSLASSEKNTLRTREKVAIDPPGFSDEEKAQGGISGDSGRDEISEERREQEARIAEEREKQQLLRDQREIADLSARDREVRAHEQAHAAVGGLYAGAPTYQYERGPDGVNTTNKTKEIKKAVLQRRKTQSLKQKNT
eukprot:TRINITY_DN46319_c0_g1_i8.p1 TRINITY_DN46319_c0_g1~~TRINITY_DN46319_c0_g1_i8.p1  ORF type:complete len:240 (-),score=28.68 TRINITY_DN46319_c0_g1_i8:18-737(-)